MSEEETKPEKQADPEVIKHYMEIPEKNIDEIKSQMINDSLKNSLQQRFGFFSIIHANCIGDELYSRTKKKIERDERGKVKIEPRGIYVKSCKKGKFVDSYFDASSLKQDKTIIERAKAYTKLEREKLLERVEKSKEKGVFVKSFLPGGPHGCKDIFYPDKMGYKQELYKIEKNTGSIDFEKKKVHTKARGIFTQPPHTGSWANKDVLFSFERLTYNEIAMLKNMTEEELKKDFEKKKALQEKDMNKKPSFMPNSVGKNHAFQNDKSLYRIDPEKYKKMLKDYEDHQNALAKKDLKHAEHMRKFYPPSNAKLVNFFIYFKFLLFFMIFLIIQNNIIREKKDILLNFLIKSLRNPVRRWLQKKNQK
jgi:hypothetical protein